MNRRRMWATVLSLLSVFLVSSSALANGSNSNRGSSSKAFGGKPLQIRQLPLRLTEEFPGTLSGLVRDSQGFYWTHTDGGSATPEWPVRLAKLKVTPNGAQVIEVIQVRDEAGNPVTGDQFDPEDIVTAPDRTLWLVDEIHPLIVQVSREGQILRRVSPPARYQDRVNGRGFEGAALSPDGSTLYIMLQTGLSTQTDKSRTWLLAYHIATGTFREYSYDLDKPSDYAYPEGVKPWIGSNGLAAVGPSELLVLERDNLSGANARVKRVYRISVPAEPTETPLVKELVVDLYALGYQMEKVEGLAVASPKLMLLINDNDGNVAQPTVLWYLQF